MPARDLALLEAAARAAGKIAMRYWKQSPQVWDKGAEGPVTEADLAVNQMLRADLTAARPGYGWLSEETPDSPQRLVQTHVFIVDPIDGTRAFIAGESAFAHSLAVAEHGQVTAAVVYLPAKNLMYSATAGGPALLNGAPIAASRRADPEGASALANAGALAPDLWPGGVPGLKRSFRASLAWRLCLVAEGAFDAMLTMRPAWEWDVAAGSLIATRAGASVTDRDGVPLTFNTPDPRTPGALAAAADLHAALMLRRKP